MKKLHQKKYTYMLQSAIFLVVYFYKYNLEAEVFRKHHFIIQEGGGEEIVVKPCYNRIRRRRRSRTPLLLSDIGCMIITHIQGISSVLVTFQGTLFLVKILPNLTSNIFHVCVSSVQSALSTCTLCYTQPALDSESIICTFHRPYSDFSGFGP